MKCALLVLLVCLSVAACANDAGVRGVGGAIAPMESHSSVRMVRERIDARIGWGTARVRCEFIFKNEGSATTVKMGFPEQSGGDSARPIVTTEFQSFKSWVDGKPVPTKLIPSAKGQTNEYKAWHVKDVAFGANQTRTVVDEYTSSLGGISDGTAFFTYVLVTGKSWKGKIGEAVVTVDASEVAAFYTARPPYESKGYVQKGSRIVWSARDFEPSKDVEVLLEPWRISVMDNPVYVPSPQLFAERGVLMSAVSSFTSIEDCVVSWDNTSKECTVSYGDRWLRMKLGSKTAVRNGKKVTLPAAPYMNAPNTEPSTLYGPILTVAEQLGIKIERNDKGRSINIGEPKWSKSLRS